jgi:polyhydroxyalkanoate synthesis repressor PhaR
METENPEAEPARAPAKIVKRYANRKLYDTSESRYVTLEEIGEMVKQGLEVQVIDNRSKGDLTAVTLAQIIFEEEKKRNRMPLELLRDIIRNGGGATGGFQRDAQSRGSQASNGEPSEHGPSFDGMTPSEDEPR